MFANISSHDICFAAKVGKDDVLFVTLMEEVGQDGKVLKIFHRHYGKNRKSSEVRRGHPDVDDGSELGRFCKRWSPWNGCHVDSKRYYELRSDLNCLRESLYVPFTELEVGLDAAHFCSTVGGLKVLKLVPHKAYAIKWDTDGASLSECGLPSSVIVPYLKDEDAVADWLSDVYGYYHDGFKTNFTETKVPDKKKIKMKVYKLVRKGKDGHCYPLFIDKKKPFVFGTEMQCEYHPTKGFAPRSVDDNPTGGWHCCFVPVAPHLSEKLNTGEERVWIECEASGKTKTYKRPFKQGGEWILVEVLKPLRVMGIDEVRAMQKEFYEKHGMDGDPYWVVLSGTDSGKDVNKTIKVAAPDHSKAVDRAREVWEPDTLECAEVYSDEMLNNKVYTLEF